MTSNFPPPNGPNFEPAHGQSQPPFGGPPPATHGSPPQYGQTPPPYYPQNPNNGFPTWAKVLLGIFVGLVVLVGGCTVLVGNAFRDLTEEAFESIEEAEENSALAANSTISNCGVDPETGFFTATVEFTNEGTEVKDSLRVRVNFRDTNGTIMATGVAQFVTVQPGDTVSDEANSFTLANGREPAVCEPMGSTFFEEGFETEPDPDFSPPATEDSPTVNSEIEIEGAVLPRLAPDGEADSDPAVGTTFPTIISTDFAGNRTAIEPDGQAKVVYFLAHWCPFCQAEVPAVQSLIDQGLVPEGVEIYSVNTLDDPGRDNWPPSAWLEGEGWTAPVLLDDADSSAFNAAGGTGTPFIVVLDGDNTVIRRVAGAQDEQETLALWELAAS